MSNHITIELCAEDRARLDRLAEALEKSCKVPTVTQTFDPMQKALADALDRASKATESHAETTEEQTPTITPQTDEEPTREETEPTAPIQTVTRAELGAKVREMMTKGFKEQTKEIVKLYAPTVPGVPDDKVAECYAKLVALEGDKK